MRITLPLVALIIAVTVSLSASEASPRVEEEKVLKVPHSTKVLFHYLLSGVQQHLHNLSLPQLPPWVVKRLLLKLKGDDDIEAIVEFTYILMKIYFTENPDLIQKAVRLAFHACIGGCDGCINYAHPGNAGLMSFVEEYVQIFNENGVKNVMTFMDFLVYSTYAAVDLAIEINNRDCNEEG